MDVNIFADNLRGKKKKKFLASCEDILDAMLALLLEFQ